MSLGKLNRGHKKVIKKMPKSCQNFTLKRIVKHCFVTLYERLYSNNDVGNSAHSSLRTVLHRQDSSVNQEIIAQLHRKIGALNKNVNDKQVKTST